MRTGRVCKNGMQSTTPRDIDEEVSRRYEDIELDETVADKTVIVDESIEEDLRDFWIALRGWGATSRTLGLT